MLGIFRPSYLVPSAHAQPLPGFEDLQKLKALVLTTKLLMQRLGKQLGMMAENRVLARVKIPRQYTPRLPDRWRGSVIAPRKLPTTGE